MQLDTSRMAARHYAAVVYGPYVDAHWKVETEAFDLMIDLSERTLGEMLALAREVNVLDDWEVVDGTIVFHLANRTIGIREAFARTFVRGLLRGYEIASDLDEKAGGKSPP